MDVAESLAATGYLAALAAFGAAAAVGILGTAAVPAPSRLAPLLSLVASVPTAGYLAGFVLAGWGLWRLVGPT